MNRFSKLLLIPAAVIAIAGGVGIAAATNGSSGDDPGTPTTVDVKGPCDELEHATDPRCDGVLVPEDNEADDPAGDNDDGQADDQNDDNGQDDQGVVEDQDDDQGEDADDQGENEDDNSGPSANSGPGSSHDDSDDNSGHDDDDSGSDDGGHSGPGGGDGEDD